MKRAMVGMVAISLLVGPQALGAQEAEAPQRLSEWLSGNVVVTSDYAFRGISQTLEKPAIQGGMDLVHPSGVYVGTWGSSVSFGEPDVAPGPRAQLELDVYGGWRRSLAGVVDLDLGAIYYAYPGAGDGRNYDFVEVGLGASRSVGGVSTGLQLKYSPDFFAGSGAGVYYGAQVGVPVSAVTLSGSVGRQTIETESAFGAPDYTDFSLGVGVGVAGFTVSGRLLSTSLSEVECFGGAKLCGARTVFSIARAM